MPKSDAKAMHEVYEVRGSGSPRVKKRTRDESRGINQGVGSSYDHERGRGNKDKGGT